MSTLSQYVHAKSLRKVAITGLTEQHACQLCDFGIYTDNPVQTFILQPYSTTNMWMLHSSVLLIRHESA